MRLAAEGKRTYLSALRKVAPEIDTGEEPLIITRFRAAPTDEEYAAYLVHLTRLICAANPHAQIVIIEGQHRMSPRQREMQVEWIRQQADVLRSHGRGTAYVFESPIQRLILTGVLRLERMPTPYKVCLSLEEARAWARAQLQLSTSTSKV